MLSPAPPPDSPTAMLGNPRDLERIHLLLVGEYGAVADAIETALKQEDDHWRVTPVGTLEDAKLALREHPFSLVLAHYRLPDGRTPLRRGNGTEVLPYLGIGTFAKLDQAKRNILDGLPRAGTHIALNIRDAGTVARHPGRGRLGVVQGERRVPHARGRAGRNDVAGLGRRL